MSVIFHQPKLLSTPPVNSSFELTFTQDFAIDEQDYVNVGWFCADMCKALNRGLEGRQLDELTRSMLDYRFLCPYYISIILYCFVPIRIDARLLVYKFSSLVFRRLNHSLLS